MHWAAMTTLSKQYNTIFWILAECLVFVIPLRLAFEILPLSVAFSFPLALVGLHVVPQSEEDRYKITTALIPNNRPEQ